MGTAEWLKNDSSTNSALAGTTWSLTEWDTQNNEAVENGYVFTPITDCVAEDAAQCTDLDKNPEAGQFKVEDIPYGTYKLQETGIPTGYEDTNLPSAIVTIDDANPNWTPEGNTPFTNDKKTGGVSWSKVVAGSSTALAGSTWLLEGPNDYSQTVEDCVAEDATQCTGLDKDPEAGKFLIEGLPWGEYTITETAAPTGYSLPDPAPTGSATITAENVDTVQDMGSFNNERILGTVTWKKVDDSNPAKPLKDSEWELQANTASNTKQGITDCVADDATLCTGLDKDPRAGVFKVTGLEWDTYYLIETKPPVGFKIAEDYKTPNEVNKFEIKADSLTKDFDVAIVNQKAEAPKLPLTGGVGTMTYILIGTLILGTASAFGLVTYRRREAA